MARARDAAGELYEMKASLPIFVIAGAAGVWLGLVLVVLKAVGIQIP